MTSRKTSEGGLCMQSWNKLDCLQREGRGEELACPRNTSGCVRGTYGKWMWKCVRILENYDPMWQLKIKMYRTRQSSSAVKFDDVIMRHVHCLYKIQDYGFHSSGHCIYPLTKEERVFQYCWHICHFDIYGHHAMHGTSIVVPANSLHLTWQTSHYLCTYSEGCKDGHSSCPQNSE
jgi:hypothetical protein